MKKRIALMLAVTMLLCLAACGGSKDGEGDKTPAQTTAPAAVGLDAKYGIDFSAEGEQKMSDERASMEKLVEVRDVWLEGRMTFAFDDPAKTYEDFVEYIGCDASIYNYAADDAERQFIWIAEGDETAKFLAVFWETPAGWTLYSVGSVNIG